MALFRKAKPATSVVRSRLPFVAAPDLVATVPLVRQACAQEDWDSARAHLAATPLHDREDAMRVLRDAAPYPWAAQQATDPLGHAIAGAVAVMTGWRARSNAASQQVSRDQFETLHQWMDRADEHLAQALAGETSDPTPCVYSIITARGREKPLASVESAFVELKRRDADHLEGHLQRLQYSCQKWFGSHDQMHAFAAGVSAAAQPGSELHVLPLVAHVERLIAFSGQAAHAQQQAYVSSPGFLQSVDRAMSLLTPNSHGHRLAHNHLAYFAWIQADLAGFDAAFSAIGSQVTTSPWELYGGDAVTVVRSRSFGNA